MSPMALANDILIDGASSATAGLRGDKAALPDTAL